MERVNSLSLELIDEPALCMRSEVYEDTLEELAHSIQDTGLIEPVIVRPKGDRYELVVGHRRLYAAKRLQWPNIPAIIRDLDDTQALLVQAAENDQRESINPIDRARYYKSLLESFGCSQRELARRLSLSDTIINRLIRLLDFDDEIQDALRAGHIGLKAAHLLAKFPSPSLRLRYLRLALDSGASLRTLQGWLQDLQSRQPAPAEPATSFPGGSQPTTAIPPSLRSCEICGDDYPPEDCQVLSICAGCFTAIQDTMRNLDKKDSP